VAVIPLHEDGTVTLVRQFRAAVMTAILEAPAGTCDVEGEPLAATARRELIEEAGLEAGRLTELIAVYNSPGFCDQRTTIFLATQLQPCPTDRSGIEEHWMSVERIALADVDGLITEGRLVDETTVLGLLLARHAV
jgi:8-oxo-dGTP pyrophosphatase MutT (NUDIX family)